MATGQREPFVLDFQNGQEVEDILKKAQNLANIQIIGAGLSLDGDTGELSASGGGMPSDVKYATNLSLTIDSSTFVVTAQLIDQNGDNLGTAQTIDLPLESVVVGGSYNDQTKKVVLTLQNGNTVEFSVADLVAGLQTELSATNKLNPAYINYDSTHAAVTEAQRTQIGTNQAAIDGQQNTTAQGGNGYAIINGVRLYVSATAPTGDIPDGSVGVGW